MGGSLRRRVLIASGSFALASACAAGCSSSPPAAALDPKAQLEKDTGVPWSVVNDTRYGTPTYLEPQTYPAPSLVPGVTPEQAAMQFFVKNAALFHLKDPTKELSLETVLGPDALGLTHATFLEKEGNALVSGMRMGVHFDAQGRIAFASGMIAGDLYGFNTTPRLAGWAALALAQADLPSRLPAGMTGTPDTAPTPALVIDTFGTAPALAYEIPLSITYAATDAADADQPDSLHFEVDYLVDATGGAILEAVNPARDGDVTASGFGAQHYVRNLANDNKQFTASTDPSSVAKYRMVVQSNGSRSTRVAYQPTTNAATPGLRIVRSNALDSWNTTNPIAGSAVDAYTYLGWVDDWWRSRYGWQSYDGQNSAIRIVDRETAAPCPNNAFWSPGDKHIHICVVQQGTFPSGGDYTTFGGACGNAASPAWVTLTPLVDSAALDIMGHEFQHAVTGATLHLGFNGQAGALDESLSDVFGNFIERQHPLPGTDPLKQGEVTEQPFVRDLQNPASSGWVQPDNLTSPHYVPEGNAGCDAGGRHFNNGVPNNAWYLTAYGGTNLTSGIMVPQGIGPDSSEKIYVSTVTGRGIAGGANRAPAGANIQTYKAFAQALVGTAKSLPGSTKSDGSVAVRGPANLVACAWYATGVLTLDDIKSTWNVPCDFNPCKDKADGAYCGKDLNYAPNANDVYHCTSGFTFDFGPCDPQQCSNGSCGGSSTGNDAGPPPPADAGTGIPDATGADVTFDVKPDLCTGRADGTYCGSDLGAANPGDIYHCASGFLFDFGPCPPGQTCSGGACQ